MIFPIASWAIKYVNTLKENLTPNKQKKIMSIFVMFNCATTFFAKKVFRLNNLSEI